MKVIAKDLLRSKTQWEVLYIFVTLFHRIWQPLIMSTTRLTLAIFLLVPVLEFSKFPRGELLNWCLKDTWRHFKKISSSDKGELARIKIPICCLSTGSNTARVCLWWNEHMKFIYLNCGLQQFDCIWSTLKLQQLLYSSTSRYHTNEFPGPLSSKG